MDNKKIVYESEVIGLPPLCSVLGDVPSPDPEKRRSLRPVTGKPGRDMIVPVRRLIAHLEGKPTR